MIIHFSKFDFSVSIFFFSLFSIFRLEGNVHRRNMSKIMSQNHTMIYGLIVWRRNKMKWNKIHPMDPKFGCGNVCDLVYLFCHCDTHPFVLQRKIKFVSTMDMHVRLNYYVLLKAQYLLRWLSSKHTHTHTPFAEVCVQFFFLLNLFSLTLFNFRKLW